MHKPLLKYDFSRRVILDTNTLLNATFNGGGLAAHALQSLRRMGTPTYVTPTIEVEVARVSDRLRRKYGLGYSPAKAVRMSIAANGIMFAPEPRGPPLPNINGADEPIARAARQLGAAIVTDDVEFIVQARAAGVEAWQYWEVCRNYQGVGELPEMFRIVRYGAPTAAGGYIFARVSTGDWAESTIDQKFSVCEVENWLWLYYDGSTAEWRAQLPSGDVVRLRMPLRRGGYYVLAASSSRSGAGATLTIMAAPFGETVALTRAQANTAGRPTSKSLLNVGHDRNKAHHWNGMVGDLVVASGGLPPRTFRLLASTEDLSPNPADSDKLAEAVQRVIMLAS